MFNNRLATIHERDQRTNDQPTGTSHYRTKADFDLMLQVRVRVGVGVSF